MARTWTVILALVTVQVAFGAYGVVVAKFAQKSKTNPLVFSLLRDAGALPVLVLSAFLAERKIVIPVRRELLLFVALGFCGVFAGQLLYILGVYWAGPNIASAFQPATPVWAALLSLVFRVEKPPPLRAITTWAKLAGILCAAAGAISMTVFRAKDATAADSGNSTVIPGTLTTPCEAPTAESSHKTVLGCVMLLGNTLGASVYILLQKKYIFDRLECRFADLPVNVTVWCYFFGALFMALALPLAPILQQPECGVTSSPWTIPIESTIPLEYAVFIAAALCYLLITWSTQQISPTVVTAFWPLQVPVAVIMSYFVLHDTLSSLQYMFCALIAIGLLLVVVSNYAIERKARSQYLPLIQGVQTPVDYAEAPGPYGSMLSEPRT